MEPVKASGWGRIDCRPYHASDLEAVIGIFHSALRETASADYDPAQIEAWSRIDRAVWTERRMRGHCRVAWIGTEAAGFADLEPDGRLDMLYVHPAHGRRGVARALLRAVETMALDLGVGVLRTEASLTARPFFGAAGFHVVEAETVTRNGQAFRRYRMRRDGLGA
ncbi:MAG TPA: GNAT family N-acetyltransferase [Methylobacterium sp.]|jgi:putative acetyltransferase|uniref:GNAT family N-acetyltransferase n=1 Tax=Methylorubrum sp. B1-46 TaxID=2897334 RepID=UPI001E4932A9|nr:GNAT family N-acetyltransferase [Methylorubrum sp. B1-46]UGB23941.1 GNAT family N-acetyltransferase [Methylorubrum sp. B1-46]HEV2542522.1 GNAT family N-acetyltransferase [Methylobacterium sp.]